MCVEQGQEGDDNGDLISEIDIESKPSRTEMYNQLPPSSNISDEQILSIKEQLIEQCSKCGICVESIKATIDKESIRYELAISANIEEQNLERRV